ncbi:hypothetical protein FOG18_07190 [Legionella israelensis]|uniref:LPS O-antigen chain length determinant protein WzzB n=1 Tax=Legionella israelensis TaxID=454 RepID=UPI00117F9F3D|nr:Wzz/FepE/Etk N-terminal domain-containing protein [Legionella israelensis]QDP72357.1 hypothetical protein FOG18_07190 [Legionella israelensis]
MERQQSRDFTGEIDIVELLHTLWRQKLLILIITFACSFIGVTYLWLKKPLYQASIQIFPPTVSDISAFNYGRSIDKNALLPSFDVKDIYGIFTRHLLSKSAESIFLEDVYLPSTSKVHRKLSSSAFIPLISVKPLTTSNPANYLLTVKSPDSFQAAECLKYYISFLKEETIKDLLQLAHRQKENAIQNLELKINLAREEAREHRKDRLVQLNEALNIAKAIGLNKPAAAKMTGNNNVVVSDATLSEPSFMYGRGIKALESEIQNLKNRKFDDPFSPELRKLQAVVNLYKKLSINANDSTVFRLDGEFKASEQPVSPKKRLILILSMTIGLVLGSVIAIIRNFFIQAKNE